MEEARRKKLIITVLVSVVAYIMILIIYMLVSKTAILTRIGPGGKYVDKVEEYLTEKYNEDFKIKFVKKRKGANYSESSCSGSNFVTYNGIDNNVEEYIYSFSPKNNRELKAYVVYSYNKNERD